MKSQTAIAGDRRSRAADVISAFSSGLAFGDLPAAAIEAAKRSILDTLAVAVAGTRSRAGQGAINAFAARGAGGADFSPIAWSRFEVVRPRR